MSTVMAHCVVVALQPRVRRSTIELTEAQRHAEHLGRLEMARAHVQMMASARQDPEQLLFASDRTAVYVDTAAANCRDRTEAAGGTAMDYLYALRDHIRFMRQTPTPAVTWSAS